MKKKPKEKDKITDIVKVNVSPVKEYTIKCKVNSIEKGSLKIYLD